LVAELATPDVASPLSSRAWFVEPLAPVYFCVSVPEGDVAR